MTGFGWLMVIVALMLGFALMAVMRNLQRHPLSMLARVIAALLPALAWAAFGALDRCMPIPPSERCYYLGMGFVVFAPFFAAWLLGSVGALVLVRKAR